MRQIGDFGANKRVNRVFATLTNSEYQDLLKAKELIRNNMIKNDLIRHNDNITHTTIFKTLLNFYCNEKKIA